MSLLLVTNPLNLNLKFLEKPVKLKIQNGSLNKDMRPGTQDPRPWNLRPLDIGP